MTQDYFRGVKKPRRPVFLSPSEIVGSLGSYPPPKSLALLINEEFSN